MKKFLWTLGIMSLINSVHAGVGIHFYNNTPSTVYLTSEYTRNLRSCKGKIPKIVTVHPGNRYKFTVTHRAVDNKPCHLSVTGYADANLSESTVVIQEDLHIKSKDYQGSYISQHDTPPSKCGVGTTCSTNLTNNMASLYLKATSKGGNQYANIMFSNNTPFLRYIKFTHLRGECKNYVKYSPWFRVAPENIKMGYISNLRETKICAYRVDIAQDEQGRNLVCSSTLRIYNDLNGNTTVHSVDGNCNVVISNNNWLASIVLN
ncbi:MAG: hypothetical protein RLZZ293_108 [Pseudomonadota bacterium]|jgi:hypothetical protein